MENITQLSQFINKDLEPIKTDKEYLTFMLNGIHDSVEGSIGSIVNEPGNELCIELDTVVGYIEGNGEIVVFIKDGDQDVIGVIKDCNYTEYLRTDCLGFDECNKIQGVYRVKKGCERIVYWNDCLNSDYHFNLDRPDQFLNESYRKDYQQVDELTIPCEECETIKFSIINNPIFDTIPGGFGLPNYHETEFTLTSDLDVYIELVGPTGFVIENTKPKEDSSILIKYKFLGTMTANLTFTDEKGCRYKKSIEIPSRLGPYTHPETGDFIFIWDLEFEAEATCVEVNVEGDAEEGQWNCNSFKIKKDIDFPCISYEFDYSGSGSFEIGAYSIVLELLDLNKNVIYKTIPTEPFIISEQGGFNISNTDYQSGGRLPVKGSLRINIDNYDSDFIKLNLIKYNSGDGIQYQTITSGQLYSNNTFVYEGFNTARGDTFNDTANVLQPVLNYGTSCFMEQVDKRLLRANLKENTYDWGEWQKAASKIGSKWITKDIEWSDVDNKNRLNCTFMPDEIRASGIVYVLADGSHSPVYHILGRPKDYSSITCNKLNEIGNAIENNSCVEIKIDITAPSQLFNYEVVVDYKDNNELKQTTKKFTFPGDNSFYICGSDLEVNLTDVSITVDSVYKGSIDYQIVYLNEEVTPGTYNTGSLTGWDSTVYSSWNQQMSHLITEEEYRKFLEVDYGNNNVDYLNTLKDCPLPQRWEFTNTARKTSRFEGDFGYYECSDMYKCPPYYCGDDFWGEDICGNKIEGTNIRHNRFPSRSIVPSSEGKIINPLGIEFFNIEYPHEDIVDHFFVVDDRSEKTVLDNGILNNLVPGEAIETDFVSNCSLNGTDTDSIFGFNKFIPVELGGGFTEPQDNLNDTYFIGPRTLYDNTYLNGDYINYHTEYILEFCDDCIETGRGGFLDLKDLFDREQNLTLGLRQHFPEQRDVVNYNHKIEYGRFLYPREYHHYTDKEIVNMSFSNPMQYIYQNSPINGKHRFLRVGSIKKNIKPFCNLNSINYKKLTCKDNSTYKGGSYVNDFVVNNSIIKAINSSFLSYYLKSFGVAAFAIIPFLMDLKNLGRYADITNKDAVLGCDESNLFDKTTVLNSELISGVFVDSDINVLDRHTGEDECETIPDSKNYYSYLLNRYWTYDKEDNKMTINTPFCREFYDINPDLRVDYIPYFYEKADYNFDYCSKCRNVFPNRIIYSELDLDNTLQDNYLNFLPNNFKDITNDKGEITGLISYKDKFFIHTNHSTYVSKTNPRILQTSEENVYIGTGEFLGIPEVELVETNYGYGGKQSRFGHIKTEFGYFWADELSGNIFSHELQPISQVGLKQWFKSNLCFDEKKCNDEMIMGYDPRFKRLLVTKNSCVCNESWTLSYSFEFKKWISWHSYLPNFYFNDNKNFYSIDKGIWKHLHEGNYGNYYGKKHDFIVEFITPNIITNSLQNIHYISYSKIKQDNKYIFVDDTFDRMWVRNSCQSTGLINLELIDQHDNPWGNLDYNKDSVSVIKTDNNYKIAQFYDISTDQPIEEKPCQDDFIDCIPINVDYDKKQFDLRNFNDKYAYIRLYFNPEKDVKKILNYIDNKTFLSFS